MIYSIICSDMITGDPSVIASFSDRRDAEHYINYNADENGDEEKDELITKQTKSKIYHHYIREQNLFFRNRKILMYKYSIWEINGDLNDGLGKMIHDDELELLSTSRDLINKKKNKKKLIN